jgi:hypothetical protein
MVIPFSPMLFILVIYVLSHIVPRTSEEGLLQHLARTELQHCIPLYVVDVVIFMRHHESLGFKANVRKSNIYPNSMC